MASDTFAQMLAREADRFSPAELAAAFRERLLAELPPIFEDGGAYLDWPTATGYASGSACWLALVDALQQDGRQEAAISWDAWDEILKAEIRRRADVGRAIRQDPAKQALHRSACRDFLFWLCEVGWIADPKPKPGGIGADIPFVPFPFQAALAFWLRDIAAEELLRSERMYSICKSRELGVSWFFMHYHLHAAVHRPGYIAKVGSTSASKGHVLGDRDSLLGKVGYVAERMPFWLWPVRPATVDMVRGVTVEHPGGTSSSIQSAAMQGRSEFGRSGRATEITLDERAAVPNLDQQKVSRSLTSVGDRIFALSTPRGRGNEFHAQHLAAPRERALNLPWTVDPRRDQQWFQRLLRRNGGLIDETTRAQEYECRFVALTSQLIFPNSGGIGYVASDPLFAAFRRGLGATVPAHLLCVGMDFGASTSATTARFGLIDYSRTMHDPVFGELPAVWWEDEIYGTRWLVSELARLIKERALRFGLRIEDCVVFGDPTCGAAQIDNRSWLSDLNRLGIPLHPAPGGQNTPEVRSQQLAVIDQLMAEGLWRVNASTAASALHADQTWQWDIPAGWDFATVNLATVKPDKKGPASHSCDGARYGYFGMVHALRAHAASQQGSRKPARRRAAW